MKDFNVETATDEEVDEKFDSMMSMMSENKISDEDIAKMSGLVEDNLTEDEILLRKLQNGEIEYNLDLANSEDMTSNMTVNPFTGKPQSIGTPLSKGDNDLQKAFDLDGNIGDIDDLELTEESIKKAFTFGKYDTNIESEDIVVLLNLINRYQKNESIKYNDLPLVIKKEITSVLTQGKNAMYSGNVELKNQLAKSFIEGLVMDCIQSEANTIFTDLKSSIDNYTKKELGDIYSKSSVTQRDIMENKLLEIAKKIENEKPEDAKRLRDISKSFIESYTFEDMYRVFKDTGKLRVKKIELEKPSRVYNEFLHKYAKTKWSIGNVANLEPILDRHLPDYINMNEIRKFVMIFCKYCKNFDPTNIKEHTFMYYFVTNIASLDIYNETNEEDKKFYDTLIRNIIYFIDLIERKEQK